MEDVPPLFSELQSLKVWTFAERNAKGILIEDSEIGVMITDYTSMASNV